MKKNNKKKNNKKNQKNKTKQKYSLINQTVYGYQYWK